MKFVFYFHEGGSTVTFLIDPPVVEAGGTISVNCTSVTPKGEFDLFFVIPPSGMGVVCTADCYIDRECPYMTDLVDLCVCDSDPPDVNDLCPEGTYSVSYTVSDVPLDMSGQWVCDLSGNQDVMELLVYGKK